MRTKYFTRLNINLINALQMPNVNCNILCCFYGSKHLFNFKIYWLNVSEFMNKERQNVFFWNDRKKWYILEITCYYCCININNLPISYRKRRRLENENIYWKITSQYDLSFQHIYRTVLYFFCTLRDWKLSLRVYPSFLSRIF